MLRTHCSGHEDLTVVVKGRIANSSLMGDKKRTKDR